MFLQFTPAYGFAFLQSGILPRAVFHKPPGRKTRCGKRTQTAVFHTVFAPQAWRGNYHFRHRLRRCHTPPFVATRHLPPERGKSSLKGTVFGGGDKVSGIAQRRPLGGAGAQRLRGQLPELPQSRYARQPPLRWGLWHSGKASGSSAKFAGAPEAPSQRELAKPIGFD